MTTYLSIYYTPTEYTPRQTKSILTYRYNRLITSRENLWVKP